MTGRPTVELITRSDCTLCEEGRTVLARWADRLGVAVVERDVSGPGLEGLSERVPVVRTAAGRIIDEGRLSPVRIVAGLVRARLGRERMRG